jgi:hypothetical protein
MKDWKAVAHAVIPGIPEEELDRLLIPLAALEETFRPLVRQLTPEVEPVTEFHAERAPE